MKNLKRKAQTSQDERILTPFEQNIEKGRTGNETDNNQSPYFDDLTQVNRNIIQSRIQEASSSQRIGQNNQAQSFRGDSVDFKLLQYKLANLLGESQKRQEGYQAFIKKKQQESYEATQKYIQSLKKYREELEKYVQERNLKKEKQFQKYQSNKAFNAEYKRVNKYKRVKLSPPNEHDKSQGYEKIDLKCKIAVKFFSPVIEDYLREKFPLNLDFKISLPFSSLGFQNSKTIQTSVRLQEDQSDNIQNLINGYPFALIASGNRNDKQIQATQGKNLYFQFNIQNREDVVECFQNGRVWMNITDRDSGILYAYSSFGTQQLLYYPQSSSAINPISCEQTQIIECYSPFSHSKNCIVHMRLQSQPVYGGDSSNKVESAQPIELAKINIDRTSYGDKESRQLQRINKFKSINHSLTMRPDPQYYDKQADREGEFINSNDKNLAMHRKMKEIENINRYKEEHKSQFMGKLLDEALQRYSLQDLEVGCPKHLVFYFEKQSSTPQKVFLKTQLKIPQNEEVVLQQLEIKVVDKNLCAELIQKGLVKVKNDASIDVDGDDKEGYYIFDNKVAFVIKVLLYPSQKLDQALFSSKNNHSNSIKIDFGLRIESDVGELLSQQVYKLQPLKLKCQYQLSFHNYECEEECITIPLNFSGRDMEDSEIMNQMSVLVSEDVSYRISPQNDFIQLKVKYSKITKSMYDAASKDCRDLDIVLLDKGNNFTRAAYKLKLFSYHKMSTIQEYHLGQICKYRFEFSLDENSKSKTLRAGFYSSHLNECRVKCNSNTQLIVQANQTYEMQAVFQTFSMNSPNDKVIIHAIDLDSGQVIKRWLLTIHKFLQDFKSVHQIRVQRGNKTTYKYFLKNRTNKEASYKFYSSNNSIIEVPEYPVALGQNQQTYIQLLVGVKRSDLTLEQRQKGIHVIVRLDNNVDQNGWNELFKIFLD